MITDPSRTPFRSVPSPDPNGTTSREEPLDAEEQASTTSFPGLPPTGHGELILVIDDYPAVRELLKAMLLGWGYQVLLTETAQAVEVFQQQRNSVRAVIADLPFPGGEAETVIQALYAHQPDLPIVALCTHVCSLQQSVVPSPFWAILPKPFALRELLGTLANALRED